MDELMPQEIVQHHFQTKISKIDLLHHQNHVSYYSAITNYGNMTLIVEKIILKDHPQHPKEPLAENKSCIRQSQARLRKRNVLIRQGMIVTPLIYQQQIKKIREDYIICMSLCEKVRLISRDQIISSGIQSHFIDLVQSACKAHKQSYQYTLKTYELAHCLQSTTTNNIYLDFTQINIECLNNQQNYLKFKTFTKYLTQIINLSSNQPMNEIIFNKESPFVFNVLKIEEIIDWFELALIFNIIGDENVIVVNQNRTKSCPIRKLQGNPKFQYNGHYYDRYKFKQGFCTDGILNLTFSDLKQKFFQDNKTYQMSTSPYLLVRKLNINPQALIYIHTKLQYDDIIYVNEQINKVQFINFIIGYMKYIQPIIHGLYFYQKDNIIQLVFTNKIGKNRKTVIKFYGKYLVKDQELSMIIQKSKIKNAVLSLEKMNLTDSFLIFLANCDKALNFKSINLSHCSKLTQSGVQLLLSSPFLKNINILQLDGLPCNHLNHIKFGLSIKQISLNDCLTQENEELDLSGFSLQKISALNYNILLKFDDSLKYLSINSYFLLDNFKYLKNLSLIALKIKVSQGKKNINTFINNFNFLSPKQNSVKLFLQGGSRKTLKLLDLSESTIKIKELKSIINIQTLQTLILDNIQNDKLSDLILPNTILNLSLNHPTIIFQTFQRLIQKMNIIIKLCIKGCLKLQQKQLCQSCQNIKYINMLQLQQSQLDYKSSNNKYNIQVYYIHLDKILRRYKQLQLYYILMRIVDKCKIIHLFVNDDKLQPMVRKIVSFIHLWINKNRNRFNCQIYINQIDICRLFNYNNNSKTFNYNYKLATFNYNKNYSNAYQHFKVHITSYQMFEITPIKSSFYHQQENQDQQGSQSTFCNSFNLDIFNVTFHKIIKMNPNAFIQIIIKDNRVLGKEVISLLKKFGCNKIKSIDFRNCLFKYEEVEEDLFSFPFLERVNGGEYQINLHRDNLQEDTLMKLLRFYLKLAINKEISLIIHATYLDHHELFFTTLAEIIMHFKPVLTKLQIDFHNIEFKEQSLGLWRTIFQLQALKRLSITYLNDIIRQDELKMMRQQFDKINKMTLQSLKLDMNTINVCQMINVRNLRQLVIIFNEMTVNQHSLYRILKNGYHLSVLHIDLNSIQLHSLNKLSDALNKLTNLTSLTINLQNCPIKENSLYQLISNLQANCLLQYIDLNINYCNFSTEQLIKILVKLQAKLKMCHMVIYGNQQSISKGSFIDKYNNNIHKNEIQLLLNGIQLYL